MKFRPLLIKGEKLAKEATKVRSGGPKTRPYTFEESIKKSIDDINSINKEIEDKKELFLDDEIILNIRMGEGFFAKSYIPSLFKSKESMDFVGARLYDRKIVDNKEVKSKLYFVKCSKDNIDWFLKDLQHKNFNKKEIEQLRSIEKIDVLASDERTLGFDEKYDSNAIIEVEVVLHPLKEENIDLALTKIESFFLEEKEVRVYEEGPIFILGKVKVSDLGAMAKYNFMRTIHPMREINFPELRAGVGGKLPQVPLNKNTNINIKVGVFDGGANDKNKYLQGYVKNYDVASLPAIKKGIEHGNAVCGAVLYGPLNQYSTSDILPTPKCLVESFRVLPERNMYITIDNVERIVKERNDIDIYNISFGPRGPILDDQIDRFTYVLDKLSLLEKVFTIAVGNDGKIVKPFNRIQAPSDAVNCIGVGAYSSFNGEKYRAEYSCIGSGREGAKIKPDLLAFGGDERNPFQAIDIDGCNRSLTAGTSFSAPVVAGKLAELRYKSEIFDSLVGRTILLHSAQANSKVVEEEGLGIVKDNIEDILGCNEKRVTLLYQGNLFPTKSYKLPIPLPDFGSTDKGSISFDWTICTLTDIDTKDADLYTNTCIEETFYPHSQIYSFTKKGCKSVDINIDVHPEEMERRKMLGYKQSENPVSDTAKRKSEIVRRAEYKWDTVSRKRAGKKIENVYNPALIISGIGRDDGDISKIRFCVAVTIEIKKYSGNLYEDILAKYPVLTPVEINETIEQSIKQDVKL